MIETLTLGSIVATIGYLFAFLVEPFAEGAWFILFLIHLKHLYKTLNLINFAY